jgi:hypothetical protein
MVHLQSKQSCLCYVDYRYRHSDLHGHHAAYEFETPELEAIFCSKRLRSYRSLKYLPHEETGYRLAAPLPLRSLFFNTGSGLDLQNHVLSVLNLICALQAPAPGPQMLRFELFTRVLIHSYHVVAMLSLVLDAKI